MITGNEPISPLHPDSSGNDSDRSGLTIRQYFAAMIMASNVSTQNGDSPIKESTLKDLAEESVNGADALIAELIRKPKYDTPPNHMRQNTTNRFRGGIAWYSYGMVEYLK